MPGARRRARRHAHLRAPTARSAAHGPSRSFAWPILRGGPYGERVITGLPEGVSLRLDGESFTRVLALGANAGAPPGGAYGAAFSSPREGWLGPRGCRST